METNPEINKKVNDIFDSVDSIKEVQVSAFFKENVMHQIRNTSEEIQEVPWSWFTPSLQLATLVLFITLNIYAYLNLNTSEYDSGINQFAETYGLSTASEPSIFN
jgi:hypothetical protein